MAQTSTSTQKAAIRTARTDPFESRREPRGRGSIVLRLVLAAVGLVLVGLVAWVTIAAGGSPDPTVAGKSATAGVLDIGILVFREGLECILVLAAITASMVGSSEAYRRPIAAGAAIGFVATLVTWRIAVGIIDNLTESFPALQIQAITGLLAIVVLLVVMNWFFHKLYWTGWISLHNKRKRELMKDAQQETKSKAGLLWGLGMLGFTSLYREGFEVVLFLQNYRLKLGGTPVLHGVLLGLLLSAAVAVLTFVAHHRLPYKKMLVLTGGLLGVVLLVMVGEQAQEMQLAHWLTTTPVPWLSGRTPHWMGLWFAIFPTVETISAQAIAAMLVLGSYSYVRLRALRPANSPAASPM